MPATYTDRLAGLTTSVAVKAPCRVATTANITLSGEQTIDGVAVVADDRVLVKDQTTASQNGIYTVSTTSWARALDFDGERDCVKGTTVKIVEGTVSTSNWYNVTSNNPITIGTSDITWAQTYVSLTLIPSATTSVEGISELLTIAELRTGTDTTRTATADAIASLWQQGADIASAATLTKPSDANLGGYHVVTGTTGISALWSSEPAGTEIELRFAGACILTHGASFILPSAANITTVAGDVARFRAEAANVWRCVSAPPSWFTAIPDVFRLPVSAKTVTYTMLAADKGSEINFTTAGVTFNLLAAATAGNGATVAVRNSAASGDVTIDPDGAETLDGLATRLLRSDDFVILRSDGANWRTISGNYSFESTELTPVIGTSVSAAHGLGVKPNFFRAVFRCKTTGGNWEVGDEIDYASVQATYGSAVGCNAITLYAGFNQTYALNATDRSTGSSIVLDYTKWKLVFYAKDMRG